MSFRATTWHRLEPRVRGTDPAVGLSAPVHDPLWLLGRQWQVGELTGEDAAFPVAVRVDTAASPLTRFAGPDGVARDYDGFGVPLEVAVEREPTSRPTLRLRLDAWSRIRGLLRDGGLGSRVAELASAHPLPTAQVAEDPSDARFRLLAGDTAADGVAVALSLAADDAGLPAALVAEFLGWYDAAVAAADVDCWVTDRLEHRFRVAASTGGAEVVLTASSFPGGRLDWYDVDLEVDPGHPMSTSAGTAPPAVAHLLPTRVTFPGMPAQRFWELEDATVDLGSVTASATDLGRLLAVEFATVFANDWWSVPVPAKYGTLAAVRSLVVRDSFGESVLVEPTEQAVGARSTAPWRMFQLSTADLRSGSGPTPQLLFLPPVLVGALEGEPLEEVLLLRDEMANLGWAVERVVEGADGRARNRSIEYGTRLTAAPPPVIHSPAALAYVLQTSVPEHWIPLVPVHPPGDAQGAVMLQRGALLTQDGTMRPITAQGTILEPALSPWYFHEEEVPRAGVRLLRVPCVARGLDGEPLAWVSRRVLTGRGEGSSGLRFDVAVPVEG